MSTQLAVIGHSKSPDSVVNQMTEINHDAFTKALQYMEEVRCWIEEVRRLNESICQDIALLVRKPWPTKTSQQPTSNPGGHPDHKPSDEKALCKSDEIFSEEEQSVLAEVDSALAQAQKLRQFQKKNQAKQTQKETVEESSKPSHNANRTTESVPANNAPEESHPNSGDASVPINISAESEVVVNAPSDVAIISAKDLERLLKKDPPTTTTTATTAAGGKGDKLLSSRPSASRTKPLQPLRSQRLTSATGRGGNARATSIKAAQYRTSSSEIGRHATRPGSSRGRGMGKQVQSTSTRPPASGRVAHHASRNQNNSRQQQHPQQGQKRGTSATKVVGNVAGEDQNRGAQHQQKQDSSREPCSQAGESETAVVALNQLQLSSSSRTQLADAKSPHSTSTKQAESEQGEDRTHFMLVRDGSSLSLPSRLKKLCQRVTKLQEQLSASYRKEKEERSGHAEWFLGLLDEDASHTDEEFASRQLAAEFRHLIQLTKDCRRQQTTLSEAPHWEDLYYLNTMASAIDERSKDLRDKLQQLREAEKGRDGLWVLYNGASSHMGEIPSSTNLSPFIWPVDDNHDSQDLLCLSGGNILQYSSLRDLQDWARLLHQVQQVRLERRLQKVVGGAVLDLLEEANPRDPSFPRLYRVAHGVVLNAAAVFPSMITDEGSER